MSTPEGMPPPLPSNPNEDDSSRILAATLTVTVAALITFITRMYARIVVVANAGLDDVFMALSVALSVSGQAVVWGSVTHGAGKHLGDIPLDMLGMGLKLNFVSQAIYLIAICTVKLSVGAMLLRIAALPGYRRLILGLMAFMALWTTMCVLTLLLQCTDIRAMWDPTIPMNCWSENTLHGLSYSNLAVSLFTDLAFALFIPVPMLWNLNVNRRTRLSLFGALGLGTFACAAAFVKIPYLVNYGKTGDWLWDSREITIWTIVECNTGIVAANMPAMRPLFRRLLDSTSLGRSGGGDGSSRPLPSGYAGGSHYQHGKSSAGDTRVSTKRDRTKSSDDGLDEASSVRAFNAASSASSYELGDRSHSQHGTKVHGSNPEAMSSEESMPSLGVGANRSGITKTMTTRIEYAVGP